MLAEKIISETLPVLHPSDTGQQALGLMDVFRVSELPVVRDKAYLGLLSDKLIYDLNLPEERIEVKIKQLHTPHVHAKQHILEAAAVMYKLNLSVLPVVDDEHNFIGTITLHDLTGKLALMISIQEPGGIIVLQVNRNNYSTSQISQIVEGNDARILNLFTYKNDDSENLEIVIKLDKVDISPVIQTFTRYNYQITSVFNDDSMLNEMYEDRMEEFIRYMEI
jgi:acetoin utilization protein AcuB